MDKGYYLCKVLKVDTLYKKIYNAQILYWDGEKGGLIEKIHSLRLKKKK